MVEVACKEAVFHFNKKHLEDPSIPMWVIKTGGKTYYVEHVTCDVPWSTKETPENSHTKGAIKIKKALLVIDDKNEAVISTLRNGDLSRIRAAKRHYARILIHNKKGEMREFISRNEIKHGEFKSINGSCGTSFTMVDIKEKEGLAMLAMVFNGCYRILQPNEEYWKAYDDPNLLAMLDADMYYDGDDDDEVD